MKQKFPDRVIVGKVAMSLDDSPQTEIQRLNSMGGVDHLAELRWKTEERSQALPVSLPPGVIAGYCSPVFGQCP